MNQYIEYRRVSTEEQGRSGLGLDAQRTMIGMFTQDGEIIGSYVDIASGTRLEGRPELDKAVIHAVREDAILIVAKADRLSRNVAHALQILGRVGEDNLLCCDCPDTNKLVLTMLFAFAEHEALLISLRTKAAMDEVKKNGSKSGEPIGRKPGTKMSKAESQRATDNRTAVFREKMARQIDVIKYYHDMEKPVKEIVELMKINGHKNRQGTDITASQVRLIIRGHL